MSRAMQLAMSEEQALALCASEKVAVSALETLPGGGVRLVCNSVVGASVIRRKAKKKVLVNEKVRERHRPISPLW